MNKGNSFALSVEKTSSTNKVWSDTKTDSIRKFTNTNVGSVQKASTRDGNLLSMFCAMLAQNRNDATYVLPSFRPRRALLKHKKGCVGEKKEIKCDMCDAKFQTANGLQDHKNAKHGLAKYQCDTCKKSYRWRSSLKYHKEHSHWLWKFIFETWNIYFDTFQCINIC